MNRRNIGRFTIYNIDDHLREAQVVLAGLVVVRAEMIFHSHSIEYTAIGEAFDAIDEGDVIPIYDAVIKYDGMGGFKLVSWKRR